MPATTRLGHGGDVRQAADADEAAALVPALIEPGDVVLVKASRGVGLERVDPRPRRRTHLMGAILIAGLASLLISIFLGPKYIQFLREREFGQHIREEGPAEHHLKAGTPTMGGPRDLHRDRRSVPDPLGPRRGQHGRVRHRARVGGDRLRRRLPEDREGALARPVGAHQARRCSC